MGERMVTFDKSAWTRKEDAFLPWTEGALERAVDGLAFTIDDVLDFYRNDVRSVIVSSRLTDFTLAPQDAAHSGQYSRFGSYEVGIPDQDFRARALTLLSAFSYGFLRVRPHEHPELMVTAASMGLFSDDEEGLPAMLQGISVIVPGQLELFSGETPALPAAPYAAPAPPVNASPPMPGRRITRGMLVIDGGRQGPNPCEWLYARR